VVLRRRDIERETDLGSSFDSYRIAESSINVGAQGNVCNVCRDGVATILDVAWAVTPERRIL
jgi:hypothetical protein